MRLVSCLNEGGNSKVNSKALLFTFFLLTPLTYTYADFVKCLTHYESYRNGIKYASNEAYTEIIEFEKNKTLTIKTTFNGKLISKEVIQDMIDGQTTNYSNLNNNLVKNLVTIADQNLSSVMYSQQIKNLGDGQMSKEIRTASLDIDLNTGVMSRTSTIQTQRDKYYTITQGRCSIY